jgi:2-dehydro-3-deoxyphosphogluconate aldolase / (4S)-4-hydroxy-2-oxoglutarate aldolase
VTLPEVDLDLTDAFGHLRIVPVVVIHDAQDAEPLALALKAGGLACAEVTLRTPAALESLRRIAVDDQILVGAGTVLRPSQVDEAVAAGARFIVTPGFSRAVVDRCRQLGVPVLPGVTTPSEIQLALDADIAVVKFFPAAAMGGVATLRALSPAFPMVRFVPTGGVSADNVRDYLAVPAVLAVGGSWMVATDLISSGRFDEIQRRTIEAVALVSSIEVA